MKRSYRWVRISAALAAVVAVVAGGWRLGPRSAEAGLGVLQAEGRQGAKEDGDKKVEDAAVASLRQAVERFIEAADKGNVEVVAATYDPGFTCVRVADEGGFAKLSRDQMLQFFRRAAAGAGAGAGGHAITTKETKIHHAEVIGDTGFVLLTRTKDLGKGFEPMFYSLVWKKQGDDWHLLREFVHQRSIPKLR